MDWIAVIFGLIGTAILSSRSAAHASFRFWAFVCYFISNVGMIYGGVAHHMWSLVVLQSLYLFFTVQGLRNNWS